MRIAKLRTYILYTGVIAVTFLTVLLIVINNNIKDGYQFLWLLPLTFMLVSIFAIKTMQTLPANLAIAIVWGGYFIRFVLTPLFLSFGNYQVVFHTLNANYIEKAILLMSYEILFVFIGLEFFLRKKRINLTKKVNTQLELESNKVLHLGLIFFSLVCITIAFYIPQIKDSFTWIFSGKSDIANLIYDTDSIAVRGTLKRVLSSLFVFIFNIIRYLIPVYLLSIVYKKFKGSRFGYLLSLLICISPFFIIGESNVQPFIGLIINVVMMSKLHPHKSSKTNKIFLLTGLVLLFSVFVSKIVIMGGARGISGLASLALAINAYFPGVGNAAAAFNIINDNKFYTLFYDLFSTIPFRYSIFPSIALGEVTLTELFNVNNGVGGNIIPCISGSEHYLGFLLAPLIPTLLVCFSVKMQNKAKSSNDYWEYFYYIYFSILVAMIPNAYNHVSFISITINQFAPLYFAIFILNKIKLRGMDCQH